MSLFLLKTKGMCQSSFCFLSGSSSNFFGRLCTVCLLAFPRLATVASFPVFGTGCMVSDALHPGRIHISALFTPVVVFPRLLPAVFPRLALVLRFPALGTRCLISRAWHRLFVFPRFAQLMCFPLFWSHVSPSWRSWHRFWDFFFLLSPLHVLSLRASGTTCFSSNYECFAPLFSKIPLYYFCFSFATTSTNILALSSGWSF